MINKKEPTVCSLFDGMSCLQIALNRIGLKPTKYYASEIDKYAMQVTMANFPETIQLGDVRNVKGSDLGFVDILGGGESLSIIFIRWKTQRNEYKR